jgi:hypothetical protein
MSDDRAALEEVAARLWDERRIVTFLLYRLTVSRLLLAADERRFAPEALREVDRAVEMLRDGELRRDEAVRGLAGLWQVPPDEVSLPGLAAQAPPPFDHIFTEHLAAFRGLAAEIESVSRENRALARAELDHLTDSIEQLTGAEPATPTTYDAQGQFDPRAAVGGRLREAL